MIHPHAAFSQEFFDVSVGQPVTQVPPHRDRDHLGREADPGEGGPRYRCADTTTEHQTTLPDMRSVNATVPHQRTRPESRGSGYPRERGGSRPGLDPVDPRDDAGGHDRVVRGAVADGAARRSRPNWHRSMYFWSPKVQLHHLGGPRRHRRLPDHLNRRATGTEPSGAILLMELAESVELDGTTDDGAAARQVRDGPPQPA